MSKLRLVYKGHEVLEDEEEQKEGLEVNNELDAVNELFRTPTEEFKQDAAPNNGLTEEQIALMERNRQAAMEKKRKHEAMALFEDEEEDDLADMAAPSKMEPPAKRPQVEEPKPEPMPEEEEDDMIDLADLDDILNE